VTTEKGFIISYGGYLGRLVGTMKKKTKADGGREVSYAFLFSFLLVDGGPSPTHVCCFPYVLRGMSKGKGGRKEKKKER